MNKNRDIDFWRVEYLCKKDSINEEIWSKSPSIEKRIQSENNMEVGAQQGMLEDKILPWVPDIIGKDWNTSSGLNIIGSAYAGFIREYSSRSKTIPLAEYLRAENPYIFHNLFLKYVIKEDYNYYQPIKNLVSHIVDLSHISLFDLCRVSFVERGNSENRKDKSGDRIVMSNPKIYDTYVQANLEWTWRRLIKGGKNIIALGYIAEHGILKLFHEKNFTIRRYSSTITNEFNSLSRSRKHWTKRYANPSYQINYWIDKSDWWIMEGNLNGHNHSFKMLPVFHPATYSNINHDQNYSKSKNVLSKMARN
jgi:hypothetical protein